MKVVPISLVFRNEEFGYGTVTVERPLFDEGGELVRVAKGKGKGRPAPDLARRDTENVPLLEDVDAYMEAEVLPHVPDAWVDHDRTKVGYEIPFTRLFHVFESPRSLDAIDRDLKRVTDRIRGMIDGLAA